jgi:ATP-dependent exoDNAse (exonuclease V) beta subunit
VPLKRLVEGAWLALGGPACARDQEDLADARAYFAFLGAQDAAGDLDDPAALDELMQELFAPPAPDADARVQVLTMHKAKGLEFDTVILPGLHKLGGRDEAQLLRWLDRPSTQQEQGLDLMMAALAATGADKDPIYSYVGDLARQQRAAEQLRQLYVATTRPKKRLHLIGQVSFLKVGIKDGVKLPRSGSLLRALWDVVAGEYETAAVGAVAPEPKAEAGTPAQRFRRLPKGWQRPAFPAAVAALPVPEAEDEDDYIPFDWVGQTTRVVGIVVHRLLQRIAEDGLELYAEPLLDWDPDKPDVLAPEKKVDARVTAKRAARIASLWPAAEALLVRHGLADSARGTAFEAVKLAIAKTLGNSAGRWILTSHPNALSEMALSRMRDGTLQQLRIDRKFEANGRLWIVDIKSTNVEGSMRTEFVGHQIERYGPQLMRYAESLNWDGRFRTSGFLFFPSLGQHRTLDFGGHGSGVVPK